MSGLKSHDGRFRKGHAASLQSRNVDFRKLNFSRAYGKWLKEKSLEAAAKFQEAPRRADPPGDTLTTYFSVLDENETDHVAEVADENNIRIRYNPNHTDEEY